MNCKNSRIFRLRKAFDCACSFLLHRTVLLELCMCENLYNQKKSLGLAIDLGTVENENKRMIFLNDEIVSV